MKKLVREKERALVLRKKGYSYSDILKEIPVARSTLSLWLKHTPLTESEKKALKKRQKSNVSRGRAKAAGVLREKRILRTKKYIAEAEKEFERFVSEPLFHTGVSLYWAEGAKRNEMFCFINSDAEMIKTMLLWLERYTAYTRSDCAYRVYVHDAYAHEKYEEWWSNICNVSLEHFKKSVSKGGGMGKKRPEYKGCLHVYVPKSSALLCKTKFWQQKLVEHYSRG